MKPTGLAYTEIKASADIVTVVDRPDIPASVLLESIGFRPGLEGSLGGERDFGTKLRYAGYPASRKFYKGFNIFDKNAGATYDIGAFLDGSNNLSLWVNDSTYATSAENSLGQVNNWFELTRTLSVTLSATPSASATTANFGLSGTGITEENQLRYWIAYNSTRGNYAFITASTEFDPVTVTSVSILGSSGLAWQSGDTVVFYKHNGVLQGYNASNGATPHIRWNDVESLVRSLFYYGSAATVDATPTQRKSLAIDRKISARNYFYYDASNARVSVPAGWYAELGGGGLIPAFKSIGSNTSPQTPTATAMSGTVSMGGFGHQVTGSGTSFLTDLVVGQYVVIDSAGAPQVRRVLKIFSDTDIYIDGSIIGTGLSIEKYPISSVEIDDNTSNNWLRLSMGSYFEVPGIDISGSVIEKYGARVYVTVLYDNGAYESDPIFQGFAFRDVVGNAALSFLAEINYARMNKRISGLNFYVNRVDASSSAFASIVDAESDYKLVFTLPFHSYNSEANYTGEPQWAVNAGQSSGYIYKFLLPKFGYVYVNDKLTASPQALSTNLQHAVDINRSYLTPRFSIQAVRAGSGLIAVDESDTMLRICNINGAAVIETDNFPDVSVDNAGSRLKIPLQSRGELIGLQVWNDKLVAIKRTEIETIDLQSGLQSIVPIDTVARNGIVSTPAGLFLPGRNGINFIPVSGGGLEIANPLWSNRYNGTERTTDNANSRISDSARVAMIAGYNPVYRDVWFHIVTLDADGTSRNLCWRYFIDQQRWFTREVGCGSSNALTDFITRKDNSFSVCFGQSTTASDNGILKYPNLDTGANYTNDTVSNYEDSVTSTDTSNSKGITTKLLLNIGNLYSLIMNAVLYEVLLDSLGVMKTAQSGTYNIKLFANNEFPTAFDSKTQPYDSKPVPRGVAPRGRIERLMVEISLSTSGLSNYKQFILSSLNIGAVTQPRIGNR